VAVLEISKFNQDEEEVKQDIQVGDVWGKPNTIYKYHIMKIHNGFVAAWLITQEGDLMTTSMSIEELQEYTLIERDGKKVDPLREFEQDSFYPVIVGDGFAGKDVAKFTDNRFYIAGHQNLKSPLGDYEEKDLPWIGEKLEIEWPEV
jgi:hypothetical protein